MFLYELLPEAPFFLECNSFTSPDPHKVSWRADSGSSPGRTAGSPPPSGHMGKLHRPMGPAGRRLAGCARQPQDLVVKLTHY